MCVLKNVNYTKLVTCYFKTTKRELSINEDRYQARQLDSPSNTYWQLSPLSIDKDRYTGWEVILLITRCLRETET